MRLNENDEVESVELDRKRYPMAESTPYGIGSVRAESVSDSAVSNRKMCIIDSGYDLGHPDLASDPSIVTGYEGPFSTAGPWSSDGCGHGTHVAGTIAAIGSNDQGVVGVNRNGQLKLHIVRIFGENCVWAWGSSLVAAMNECVDAGADVVNMSLGGSWPSAVEEAAAARITNDDGVLLVAAAGNDGNDSYSYPASYSSIMSVAAVDSNNDHVYFSQYNDEVDIAAPGWGTESTCPSSSYCTKSGTSMASPHVAGVAALVWSLYPSKTNLEIREALEQSAEDFGTAGRDNYYGHGLVRADRAKLYLDTGSTARPTVSPTPGPPTVSPTPAPPCDDNPVGWFDKDGPEFDCEWYSVGSNCEDFGDFYEREGTTANVACCSCGGGTPLDTPSPVPASPSPSPSASPVKKSSKAPSASPVNNPSAAPSASPVNNPSAAPSASPVLSDECPSGQAKMVLTVTADGKSKKQNIFIVKKRNANKKFKIQAWKKNKFPNNQVKVYETCMDASGCYKTFMKDKGKNGMCCNNGQGGYAVTFDGVTIMDTLADSSSEFGKLSKSAQFGEC